MPDTARLRCLLAALTSTMMATAATAQTYVIHRIDPTQQPRGSQTIHISKVSVDGQKIRLWSSTMIAPDCTPSGTITSALVDAPRHGHADILDTPFYPSFTPPNPRAACDRQKVPGKVVFYTPEAGFHGHDHVTVQNANSDGFVRRIAADIEVR